MARINTLSPSIANINLMISCVFRVESTSITYIDRETILTDIDSLKNGEWRFYKSIGGFDSGVIIRSEDIIFDMEWYSEPTRERIIGNVSFIKSFRSFQDIRCESPDPSYVDILSSEKRLDNKNTSDGMRSRIFEIVIEGKETRFYGEKFGNCTNFNIFRVLLATILDPFTSIINDSPTSRALIIINNLDNVKIIVDKMKSKLNMDQQTSLEKIISDCKFQELDKRSRKFDNLEVISSDKFGNITSTSILDAISNANISTFIRCFPLPGDDLSQRSPMSGSGRSQRSPMCGFGRSQRSPMSGFGGFSKSDDSQKSPISGRFSLSRLSPTNDDTSVERARLSSISPPTLMQQDQPAIHLQILPPFECDEPWGDIMEREYPKK